MVIAHPTGLEFLELLLSRLDGYSGPAWTSHQVSLLRHLSSAGASEPTYDVMHELRLVGDADGTGVTGTAGGRHRGAHEPGGDPADRGETQQRRPTVADLKLLT